ncbi:uncharacterized protein LOC135947029 [Cloeon dipterum]|uniref:uncharacterized protein LOC135947029 n=1 Tax=Cloeon dipterum TaxID=197152 RepID=UPI00322042D5
MLTTTITMPTTTSITTTTTTTPTSTTTTTPTSTTTTTTTTTTPTSTTTTTLTSTTTTTPTTTPAKRCNGVSDITCRPKTTCTVDTNLATQLQSSGAIGNGYMFSTANGKKYFIGVDYNTLSYDSTASVCCQIGLKLAEFTTADSWSNFIEYFKTLAFSSWDFFGETTDNGNGTDTWCLSGALVPAGVIPDTFYNLECGIKNLLVLIPGGIISYIDPYTTIHRYFCE